MESRRRCCWGAMRRTFRTRPTRRRGPQQRPSGVRGGSPVDASPRLVALVDRPASHCRSRRRARSSPREPPSPPLPEEPQELPTRLAPSVSPRPSGVRGGHPVDVSPRPVALIDRPFVVVVVVRAAVRGKRCRAWADKFVIITLSVISHLAFQSLLSIIRVTEM